MKNLKLFYLAILAFCFSFVSCSDDDDSTAISNNNAIVVSGDTHSISSGYVILNDSADETDKYVEFFMHSPEFNGFNPDVDDSTLPTKNGDLISLIVKVDDFDDLSPNEFNHFSQADSGEYTSIAEAIMIYALDINLIGMYNEIEGTKEPKEVYKLKYITNGSLSLKRMANNQYVINFSGKDIDNKSISFKYNGNLPTYKASEIMEEDNPLNAYSNFKTLPLAKIVHIQKR